MKRTPPVLCAAALFLSSFAVTGDTVTLPAVTSLPVGSAASPFFSDVRVFNTSYTGSVSVTAVYRCFIPQGCLAAGREASFVLGPRESRAFDDMILATFNSPATAGAVEFTSAGDSVRVTSRLYSPAAGGGTNGMFIPGMKVTQAYAVSVLTGLSNGLFRTNIGVYNGSDVGVTATIRLFNGAAQLGSQTVSLGPRSGTQINRIFDAVGQAGLVTTNAHAVVESSSAPLFTYGAVIDNATADSSFVAGDEDAPPPPLVTATPPPPPPTVTPTPTPLPAATPTPTPEPPMDTPTETPTPEPPVETATPTPTATPFPPTATATTTPTQPPPPPSATPTPTAPAATPTPTQTSAPSATVVTLVGMQFSWSFDGGSDNFTMQAGKTYELHITTDDVIHGFSGIPALGLSGATISSSTVPVIRVASPTSAQVGVHPFECDFFCGVGHPFSGTIQVVP